MRKEAKIGRIRYDENWHGEGEHYVFEWKWGEDDPEWKFQMAAPIISDREHSNMIHFTALTQIREWQRVGITELEWA